MTEVPGSEWTSSADGLAGVGEAPFDAAWRPVTGTVVHVFTHFRLELNVYCATRRRDGKNAAGVLVVADAESLPGEALPSVMKKVIEAALPGATAPKPKGRHAA